MQNKTWKFIDKSAWGEGAWQREPDKEQWTDLPTGLPCLIVRSPHHGALCGYVGVAEQHPLYGKDYEFAQAIEVHGGLSFANFCQNENQTGGICHFPDAGEPAHVWWLGFDCAHSGDKCPAYAGRFTVKSRDEHYRDWCYVKEQCRQLARQLVCAKTCQLD